MPTALTTKFWNVSQLSERLGVPTTWIYDRTRKDGPETFPTSSSENTFGSIPSRKYFKPGSGIMKRAATDTQRIRDGPEKTQNEKLSSWTKSE